MAYAIRLALQIVWLLFMPIVVVAAINLIFSIDITLTFKVYFATAFLLYIIHDLTR